MADIQGRRKNGAGSLADVSGRIIGGREESRKTRGENREWGMGRQAETAIGEKAIEMEIFAHINANKKTRTGRIL